VLAAQPARASTASTEHEHKHRVKKGIKGIKGDNMKNHISHHAPKFQVGEMLTLQRFLPPILSGSTVSALAISHTRSAGDRYQVASSEYPGKPVWADEDDLAFPIGEYYG
jgi:hypothetical protein